MDIKGFQFSAVEAAIKKPGRKDLALIYSEVPAAASAVFTRNAVKAAPVLLSMERIRSGRVQALIVNSGNANACTGEAGMLVARDTSRLVAEALGIADEGIQVSSTGVIGVQMPQERITAAIPGLVEGLSSGTLDDIAQAIMTTDTFPKMEARSGQAGGISYSVAGIAKGAGMIMPNMATMLSFIISDAAVEPAFLDKAFRRAVDASFNAITVDGDMSTNDTCLIMANGAAGNPPIQEDTPEAAIFEELLHEVLLSLAKQIVRDGEGATKFVEICVTGAKNDQDAKRAALSIANSSLVKTAFFGQDANWGRIFAAVGYSGAEVVPAKLNLHFDDVCMASKGVFAGGDAEQRGSEVLRKKEFRVVVDLGLGRGMATVYTSDLSHDYVSINADYRT
ncbi:bifunctional glutamate N-acetyltransferase/amino-acid acetyltransferase ArgJ [Geobacter sp. SVR]|uniref:bifunctional glutamate N-acetyltransferase/amino-acid acetyltransferase ArgJ n=1 Tax=Geobacter sp. SVR TaxID=2495594 RepID=UPI00143EFC2F|nr:bifunctional glutamate N-acetyltransferase/amino-acid acetyltransferase ArgJ [Geobacter sp. SVR]BCS53098.1 arginine biosynthesis bifunctional protein ArgJ [Geobacter sp. SVR]GCF84483.1 arginine biosynthesis bifunctional protein ArgJ [Geobacter sp. SVR]